MTKRESTAPIFAALAAEHPILGSSPRMTEEENE
jgi:hypothetical protein